MRWDRLVNDLQLKLLRAFLTCRIEREGVVEDVVDQEVVGGNAKFSTAVVVVAVGSDDGVQLHLSTDTRLLTDGAHRIT